MLRSYDLASSSLALGIGYYTGGIMETEKCVNCGVDTNVLVSENVDLRKNYVEGAGQLCEECWNKIYKK